MGRWALTEELVLEGVDGGKGEVDCLEGVVPDLEVYFKFRLRALYRRRNSNAQTRSSKIKHEMDTPNIIEMFFLF